MNPIIKWPGGKSREIDKIEPLIPTFNRYVEPFFGGGALFFHLAPKSAAINDISQSLIQYYNLIKNQDRELYDLLICYNNSFNNIVSIFSKETTELLNIFFKLKDGTIHKDELNSVLEMLISSLSDKINSGFSEKLLLDKKEFDAFLHKMVEDKFIRTVANYNLHAIMPPDPNLSFHLLRKKRNLLTVLSIPQTILRCIYFFFINH